MPDAPRIVFFGMPNTGKTGLMHAFADPEAPFPLSKYGDDPPADLTRTLPGGIVLCDVDGRRAGEIIVEPRRVDQDEQTANTVRGANAIVLAIDASATDEAAAALFGAFATFLEEFEGRRCAQREVGGLPVFLTLTKCDRLYQAGDDPGAWLRRVEARKLAVRGAFEDYLAAVGRGRMDSDPFAFGSIEVRVAATALQFPKAAPFRTLDAPFGAEELREDCLAAAAAHHRRSIGSHRRLRWTLAGSGLLLGSMALALGALVTIAPPDAGNRLERRVRAYLDHEGPPAVRLADRQIEKNRRELQACRDDDDFKTLPGPYREFLEDRLEEIAAYRIYRDRFLPPRIGPAEVRNLRELDALAGAIDAELKPPPEYAAAWAKTEAVQLADKWRTDAALIRTAESALNDWYRGLVRRGTGLLVASVLDPVWRRNASALLADARTPPFDPDATIAGSVKLPVPRGAAVTYDVVFAFDRVENARSDWHDTRDRVLNLREFGDALGLTGLPDPPLVLPRPTNDPAVSARLAADRSRHLKPIFGTIGRFPDPIRGQLQKQLQLAQDAGSEHVRLLLRSRLTGSDRAAWRAAARWFDEPDAQAWRQWLARIGHWGELESADPVRDALAFLDRDAFESDLTSLDLALPNDLRERRLIPRGPLVVQIRSGNDPARELPFRIQGEPQISGRESTYRFVPDGHDGKPTFRPADAVTARLAAKAGERDYSLEWDTATPAAYAFDCLNRQPTVKLTAADTPGERTNNVRLSAPNLPRLPMLLRLN